MMRKLKAIILIACIVGMLCSMSFAESGTLDPGPGMFQQHPFKVDAETSISMELECAAVKYHEKWQPTFGVKFVGGEKKAFLRFFINKSRTSFAAYLQISRGKEKISSTNLGKNISVNEKFKLRADWHSDKLKIYINGQQIAGPIDLDVQEVILSCSTATLEVKDVLLNVRIPL